MDNRYSPDDTSSLSDGDYDYALPDFVKIPDVLDTHRKGSSYTYETKTS